MPSLLEFHEWCPLDTARSCHALGVALTGVHTGLELIGRWCTCFQWWERRGQRQWGDRYAKRLGAGLTVHSHDHTLLHLRYVSYQMDSYREVWVWAVEGHRIPLDTRTPIFHGGHWFAEVSRQGLCALSPSPAPLNVRSMKPATLQGKGAVDYPAPMYPGYHFRPANPIRWGSTPNGFFEILFVASM